MIAADAAVKAPLVGPGPALPLSSVILAHQAIAAKIFAADMDRALMDAQVATLCVVAQALTSLDPIDPSVSVLRVTWMNLVRPVINTVDRLVVLSGYRHANGHVLLLGISVFSVFNLRSVINHFFIAKVLQTFEI